MREGGKGREKAIGRGHVLPGERGEGEPVMCLLYAKSHKKN